ncbi:hypothetical protein D9613_002576 [Agrocybe pediades]|uniref:Uncharacterized protein n=1 Tax=Agrocybe pediades TaxID=84607 RepID=A0A8H4VMU8_9AGAR|nr:hypothetical protein D9613_002576 [Agrocybe pediades]
MSPIPSSSWQKLPNPTIPDIASNQLSRRSDGGSSHNSGGDKSFGGFRGNNDDDDESSRFHSTSNNNNNGGGDDGDNDNNNSGSDKNHDDDNSHDDDDNNKDSGSSKNNDDSSSNHDSKSSSSSQNHSGGSSGSNNSGGNGSNNSGSSGSNNTGNSGGENSPSGDGQTTVINNSGAGTNPDGSTVVSPSPSTTATSLGDQIPETLLPATTSSSSPIPNSSLPSNPSSTGDVPSATVLPSHDSSHALPLSSIIAIVFGILFCLTVAGVVYFITRSRFRKRNQLWKKDAPIVYPPYPIPNNESSFGTKELGYGYTGSIYRPLYETSGIRPISPSFANLGAFHFGGIPHQQGFGGFVQIATPEPVARKSTSSRPSVKSSTWISFRSSLAAGPSALPGKVKSWYSNLACEYPRSTKKVESSIEDFGELRPAFEYNMDADSIQRTSMISVEIDRNTLIIPHRSSAEYPHSLDGGTDTLSSH